MEDDDEADFEVIKTLLKLRDVRDRTARTFNITAEMRKENNQVLVSGYDSTDFVVSTNMSSLLLAQLSQNAILLPVFNELLSNEGNEVYIRNAAQLGCTGICTMEKLRKQALLNGYIILGFMDDDHPDTDIQFNLNLEDIMELTEKDRFVILANE